MPPQRGLPRRARETPGLGDEEQQRRLQRPEDGEVEPHAAGMELPQQHDVPSAPLGGEGGIERGQEGRGDGQAEPGEGRGHAREQARAQRQRRERTSDIVEAGTLRTRSPTLPPPKGRAGQETPRRERAFFARRDPREDGEAGQQEDGGDLGHESQPQRRAQEHRAGG